ncbi:hypothetical protein DPMN_047593 [Dreissena polymorpha]|uniref:Uncharacterized protein n=1 Tax=Dreissena polymorpha TaxID=45954 RepID=A0A9D4I382_DREPO|nr:hypothetical protein DPMN_047592 [Dreissena polymorpha]KAH3740877.1 hypothetical protein DPMN_047593 [Dreissena polymorpha]
MRVIDVRHVAGPAQPPRKCLCEKNAEQQPDQDAGITSKQSNFNVGKQRADKKIKTLKCEL